MTNHDRQDDNEDAESQTHPIDPPVPDEQRYRLEIDAAESNSADSRRRNAAGPKSDDPAEPSNDATVKTRS